MWLKLQADADYQAGRRERYKVEQKFAEGKRYHGWGRCRYLGLKKYTVQSLLTAMALNLKRMLRLLAGVAFRSPVRAVAGAQWRWRGLEADNEVLAGVLRADQAGSDEPEPVGLPKDARAKLLDRRSGGRCPLA